MVRYEVEPVLKKFSNGKTAINILPDGSGMVFYPSGHAAIAIEPTESGIKQIGYEDDKKGTVLFNFDESGVGSVMWGPKSSGRGKARFVCEMNQGMFLNENGDVTKSWPWRSPIGASWEPDIPDPWTFKLNQYLTFHGSSRQDLKVEVRIESVVMNCDVGETLKRKDDYLHTEHFKGTVMEGPDRGKKIFSFPPKTSSTRNAAQWAAAQRIMEPGGFTRQLTLTAQQFGMTTGSLVGDRDLRSPREDDQLDQAVAARGAIAADRELSKKLAAMTEMRSNARMGTMKVLPFVELDAMNEIRVKDTNELQNVGGPQPAQRTRLREDQRLIRADRGKTESVTHLKPPCPRKVVSLSAKSYQDFVTGGCPKTQILLVCVLQSAWQPESRSILSMIQDTWGEWTRRPNADGTAYEDVPADDLPYRLVRFEQSESNYLIKRYKFHATPMFLAYCGGKLVFAEPTFAHFACTRNCMEKTLAHCAKEVKLGNYLPDDFRFDMSNAK